MYRSLTAAVMLAVELAAWATCSSRAIYAQEKAKQPVLVYVAALKGDCMPDRPVMFVNGRAIVVPPNMAPPAPPPSGKTILTRFGEDLISQRLAEDEFRKNNAFRVVDSPTLADFVFCLCTKYHDFRNYPQMPEGIKNPETVRVGTQAAAVSIENYLKAPQDPRALAESAFWKSDDQTIEPPDEKAGKANDKDRKRKEKKNNRTPEPVLILNGLPVEPQPEVLPYDLAKRLIKLWPAFAATVAAQPRPQHNSHPNSHLGDAGKAESSRPKLPSDVTAASANETPSKADAAPAEPSTLRIETTLVVVPVMAMDKNGKYLPGLAATDFEVYEDGVKQEISDFGSVEAPIHVALILDVSGSTRFKLEDIQDAARTFVDQLRPKDHVMVVSFDQEVRVEAEFTNDRDKLMSAILRTRTGGGTRVQDALDLTLTERLNKIQGRKAIVVFTDGMDNSSRFASWQDVKKRVEESGVIVYPVNYDTMADMTALFPVSQLPPNAKISNGLIVKEYEKAAQNLKSLASVSGGRYYEVATISDTKQAFANIAEELRRYYWLGYYPGNTAHDGSYRKIRVAVGKSEAVLRARPGYRAPSSEGRK